MNLIDLMKLERYIMDTKDSGEEIDSSIEIPLKEMLINSIIETMHSNNSETRSMAHRVSRLFLACDADHKRRVLQKMSSPR